MVPRARRWLLVTAAVAAVVVDVLAAPLRVGGPDGVLFESNWDTANGDSVEAVTDGGRWPKYWEFNSQGATLLSVVSNGVNGHNALRVQQRGSSFAANLQIDDFLPQSQDYYLRYYVRNDDTSHAGDHIVTADTFQYPHLTFLRKYGGQTQWRAVISLYGCGFTYPIGHWSAARELDNGEWYRFEYFVDYVSPTRVQVHPRVYDSSGRLILTDENFVQQDFGSAVWQGEKNWTLASYYDSHLTFCVDPQWTNDFALGNNGQFGADDTGQSWYFAAVQIRNDGWPGPVDGVRRRSPRGSLPGTQSRAGADERARTERRSGSDVIFAERFDEPGIGPLIGRWSVVHGDAALSLSTDAPERSDVRRSLAVNAALARDREVSLYRRLVDHDGPVYLRYYIKLPDTAWFERAGVWLGGAVDALAAAALDLRSRPLGSDRFAAGADIRVATARITPRNYWLGMTADADDADATRAAGGRDVLVSASAWACVEQMVLLNEPVTSANGEHHIWIDGRPVTNVPDPSRRGQYRWRTDSDLRVNGVWLVVTSSPDARELGLIHFAELVVATRRIGCLP